MVLLENYFYLLFFLQPLLLIVQGFVAMYLLHQHFHYQETLMKVVEHIQWVNLVLP